VIHSDTLARLKIQIDVEFVNQVSILPEGLSEAVLPFDFSTLPNTAPGILSTNLPAGAKILPGLTSVQVLGAFDDTRIVPGIGLPPGASSAGYHVAISPNESQAQCVPAGQGFPAVSVDLLLTAVSPSAQLSLDLRADFNGKPNDVSLLPEPPSFTVTANPLKDPVWVNVPLPQQFNFEKQMAYWLALASLEGGCEWTVQQASQGMPGVQHTLDGGLSWRQAGAIGASGPVDAAFRVRKKPDTFQVPIQLHVGSEPVPLNTYQPLARVDFVLNAPQFANAFNQHLVKEVPPPLPEGEHLPNGGFEKWKVVGNTLGAPFQIPLDVSGSSALAVSPDGRWVYVGVFEQSRSAIKVIDSVCESGVRNEITLQTDSKALAIVVHPSGTRAYIITSETLHVLDLQRRLELGTHHSLGHLAEVARVAPAGFGPNLALSPDGSQLYLTIGGTVVSVGTAALEQVGRHLRSLAKQDLRTLRFSPGTPSVSPAVMALSPNGTRLFLEADAIELEDQPVSIDFTPDGSLSIVATTDSNTATLIDTATAAVVESASLSAKPLAVAVSPDGTRAYMLVSGWSDEGIATASFPQSVNLNQLPIAILLARSESGVAVAVSPQGDRVYLHGDGTLVAVPIGSRVPADWFVTTSDTAKPGEVTQVCFPQDSLFELGLEFGRRSRDGLEPNSAATGLSQVVGAAPLCNFEFSFWAVSADPSAVAELLWLDQGANLLRKDSLPIQEPVGGLAVSLWNRGPRAVFSGELRPVLHRFKITSPAGTDQVEVRFTIPGGVGALLTSASLNATSEAVVNGDLQVLQKGVPVGWKLAPQAIRGVSFSPAGGSIRFINSSIADADLVQGTELSQAGQFTFEFVGRIVEAESSTKSAQLELRRLKADGSLSAPPTKLQIPTAGFGRYLAGGTATAVTTHVEIHLKVPAGVALEVGRVSLKTLPVSMVPISFLAEAPGQLRVSNAMVSYDRIPIPPPTLPADKLASPTPPEKEPAAQSNQEMYCPRCQTKQLTNQARTSVITAAGPALLGLCPECGSQLLPGEEKLAGEISPIKFPILPTYEKGRSVFVRPADRLKRSLRPLARVNTRIAAGKTKVSAKPAKRGRKNARALPDKDK
jgi:DNA-binding beta-propeller fold protein YncE